MSDRRTGKPAVHAWTALLVLALAGCDEGGSPLGATAPLSAPIVQKEVFARKELRARRDVHTFPAPLPLADKKVIPAEESAQLAQLAALPLLALLSEREQVDLLKHLPLASPFERLSLINRYPAIAVLPDQQKQVLLHQLEKIVPIRISSHLLVCNCSNAIKREICVQEACANHAALRAMCNQACGTLAAFQRQCFPSQRCEMLRQAVPPPT